MDLSRETEQGHALHSFIVPGVKAFPGVLHGHWMLDRTRGEGHAVVTFGSREAAEEFRSNVEGNASNQAAVGIELIDIRVLEIQAAISK